MLIKVTKAVDILNKIINLMRVINPSDKEFIDIINELENVKKICQEEIELGKIKDPGKICVTEFRLNEYIKYLKSLNYSKVINQINDDYHGLKIIEAFNEFFASLIDLQEVASPEEREQIESFKKQKEEFEKALKRRIH